MKVFLRFKPNISALRQSLSHIPGLGFLSSPSEADWRLHSLGIPWKKFGICRQTSLARAGLTPSGRKMGTKIKKIGNYISNAGSSQHKWNKDGQDWEVFQQHEKNLFKVGEAGWESHSQCPCNYCHVHRRERPQQGKPSLSNLWELRMFPNTALKSRTVGRYEKKIGLDVRNAVAEVIHWSKERGIAAGEDSLVQVEILERILRMKIWIWLWME